MAEHDQPAFGRWQVECAIRRQVIQPRQPFPAKRPFDGRSRSAGLWSADPFGFHQGIYLLNPEREDEFLDEDGPFKY